MIIVCRNSLIVNLIALQLTLKGSGLLEIVIVQRTLSIVIDSTRNRSERLKLTKHGTDASVISGQEAH